MTDERVTNQEARAALTRINESVEYVSKPIRDDLLRVCSFIDQHPDTQGELVAWRFVGHGTSWDWSNGSPTEQHTRYAERNELRIERAYASPPSDAGLRRALLALLQEWRVVRDEYSPTDRYWQGTQHCIRDLEEALAYQQRELAGQGTPSVGSSGEVSP